MYVVMQTTNSLITGRKLAGVRKWVLLDTIKCCHADSFMLHLSGCFLRAKHVSNGTIWLDFDGIHFTTN